MPVVGKRTYALVILGALSALCLYAQSVLSNGFDFNELIKFINSEAMIGAIGFLRSAIAKK